MESQPKECFTLETARKLQHPTQGFLCQLKDNIYDIEFIYFKIRNCQTDQVLFEIRKPQKQIGKPFGSQAARTVKYQFGPHFFSLGTIGTTLEFKVGKLPVKKFTMIERHYFKGKLIKSFEFQVPFCMPNSVNSLEAVYEFPDFDEKQVQDMINSPFETISDSFYFVQNKLVLHNKAQYSFAPFQ